LMSMLGLFGPLFYLTSTFADSEWVAVAGIFDAEPPSASIPKKPRWRCWIGVVEDYREPKTPSHHKASANILNGVGVRWCYGAIGWTTIDANEFPAVLFRRIRLGAEALGDFASRIDAGLAGEIDGAASRARRVASIPGLSQQ
jgi:hypothetical protein